MTRGEGTGRILLGHVEPPEELDPEVGVDHVVHVVSVGGHGARGTQLAVELDTVLAQDVARYPHLGNVFKLPDIMTKLKHSSISLTFLPWRVLTMTW